jgi:hypothetical protein
VATTSAQVTVWGAIVFWALLAVALAVANDRGRR